MRLAYSVFSETAGKLAREKKRTSYLFQKVNTRIYLFFAKRLFFFFFSQSPHDTYNMAQYYRLAKKSNYPSDSHDEGGRFTNSFLSNDLNAIFPPAAVATQLAYNNSVLCAYIFSYYVKLATTFTQTLKHFCWLPLSILFSLVQGGGSRRTHTRYLIGHATSFQ